MFSIKLTFGLASLLSTSSFTTATARSIPNSPETAEDLVQKHLNQQDLSQFEQRTGATGFEDLDYWQLELELAQEMVRLNKQKKFLEDQSELRSKLGMEQKPLNTWQATEGEVDALIRSGIQNDTAALKEPLDRPKRAASKSVEQRMLSAKYNRRGGIEQPSSSDYSKPQQMSPDVRMDEAGIRDEKPEAPSPPEISQRTETPLV